MEWKDLNQIRYLNKEIKMWQQELSRIQCKSLVKSPAITGMPGGGTKRTIADIAAEEVDLEKIIEGKLAEIQLARKKTIEYIQGIEDSRMRQILFFRYVSCMSWYRVAAEMRETEGSVKMAHKRFVESEFPRKKGQKAPFNEAQAETSKPPAKPEKN